MANLRLQPFNQEIAQNSIHIFDYCHIDITFNNVANSLMAMSAKMGVNFIACGPNELRPSDEIVAKCKPIAEKNGSTITVTSDVASLNGKVDVIYTDVW